MTMKGAAISMRISSWWVNLFGHANPGINAALKDQLDTLEHAMLAGCTHEPAVLLAERLSALTQHTLGHAFFASDGASAVEIALKMSFHTWRNRGQAQKSEFVCLANSYHGETIGALGVTDVALFKDAYDPLIRHAHVVASPDARKGADAAQQALAAMRALFEARSQHLAARDRRTARAMRGRHGDARSFIPDATPRAVRRIRRAPDRR